MKPKSFKEIRAQYPNDDDYLVLVDCTTRELSFGEIEVTEAKHVEPFRDFRAMYDAYKDFKQKGLDAWFVLPT